MIKSKYDITIAILNYNREKFLDRAVRSCVTQMVSGKSLEVIVIDDCSSDNSKAQIQNYKDNFLKDIIKTTKIVLKHFSIKRIWAQDIAQNWL